MVARAYPYNRHRLTGSGYLDPEFQTDDESQRARALPAAFPSVAQPEIAQFGHFRAEDRHRIRPQKHGDWGQGVNPLPVTRLANRTAVITDPGQWQQILTYNENRFYFLIANTTGGILQFSFDKSPWPVGIPLNTNGIFQQMGFAIAANEIYVRAANPNVIIVAFEGVASHPEHISPALFPEFFMAHGQRT
jgi:hypothetical protein